MRGKNKGWTPEEDLAVLSGRRVEGRTAQESANRRYKLRKCYSAGTAYFGGKFLEHLVVLRSIGQASKLLSPKFIDQIAKIVKEIKNSKREAQKITERPKNC